MIRTFKVDFKEYLLKEKRLVEITNLDRRNTSGNINSHFYIWEFAIEYFLFYLNITSRPTQGISVTDESKSGRKVYNLYSVL